MHSCCGTIRSSLPGKKDLSVMSAQSVIIQNGRFRFFFSAGSAQKKQGYSRQRQEKNGNPNTHFSTDGLSIVF